MRLTNEMRNAFIKSVMKSVKIKVKHNKESILDEINKRLALTLPQEVQDFSKKYPDKMNFTSFHISFMDYHYMAQDGTRQWSSSRASAVHGADIKLIELDDLKAMWKQHRNEVEARLEMQSRLMEVAKSVTTTEALEKVFPKLLKHIPRPVIEKKSLPVAATGLMDELVKLGLEQP